MNSDTTTREATEETGAGLRDYDRGFPGRAGIAGEENQRRMALAEARNGAAAEADSGDAEEAEQDGEIAGAGSKIGVVEGALMIGVALLVDAAQALATLLLIGVVLNTVIGIIAWLIFFVWFKMKGVSFGFPTRGGKGGLVRNPLMLIAGAGAVEFIPFINNLPAWALAVGIAVVLELKAARTS